MCCDFITCYFFFYRLQSVLRFCRWFFNDGIGFMKEWWFWDYYGFLFFLFFICVDVDDAINGVKLENNKNKK